MYKGCSSLTSINGMNLHKNIVNFDEFINDCPNLINANNVVISGSFYNDVFKGITSIKFIDNLLIDYVGRSMSATAACVIVAVCPCTVSAPRPTLVPVRVPRRPSPTRRSKRRDM